MSADSDAERPAANPALDRLPDAAASDDAVPVRSIGRNIGALLTSQVVTWTLATVLVWIVPRYLGVESFGSLRLVTSFWAIATVVATFGTSTMMTAEIARRRPSFQQLIRNSLRVRIGLFVVLAPVVMLILVVGPYDRATIEVGAIVGVGAIFTLIATGFESGLHGLQEMGVTGRIRVITKLALTISTIVVVVAGGRLLPVATVGVLGTGLTAALFALAARRLGRTLVGSTNLARWTLLAASAPFFAAEATRVVYQQIDTVAMSLLVDSTAIGWYAAADTLFGSLLFVPVIATTAMFPAIAHLHEHAPEQVGPMLRRSFNTLLLVSVPIGVGTIVVAPSFIELLYGEAFDGAAPVLAVYGVVVMLSSQTILLGRFALATGRAKFWSSSMMIVTALSIPLDIALVPWTDRTFDNGAIGGALAYVVTEGLLIVVGLATFGRSIVSGPTARRVLRCGIAAAAMLAASWPFRDEFFMIPGAIASLVYLAVIIGLRTLQPHEREYVARGRARLARSRQQGATNEEST